MFTGIIDHVGTIAAIHRTAAGIRMQLKTQFHDLILGESISVEGICLTVSDINDDSFYCDISPETLKLTTAAHFRKNQQVNLERALRSSDRLGGHFVLGHVDKMVVTKIRNEQADYLALSFSGFTATEKLLLVPKGSIAINGVSLTLNAITDDDFQIMLVPHTLQKTNLDSLQVGDSVNIEFDYLAKIVRNVVA
ncbi:riboflavin synthase [soil metagenome]